MNSNEAPDYFTAFLAFTNMAIGKRCFRRAWLLSRSAANHSSSNLQLRSPALWDTPYVHPDFLSYPKPIFLLSDGIVNYYHSTALANALVLTL